MLTLENVPELWLWAVCESKVGFIEGLYCPNVLPVAIIQVRLNVHAHVFCAWNDLAAKVIGLQLGEGCKCSTLALQCADREQMWIRMFRILPLESL